MENTVIKKGLYLRSLIRKYPIGFTACLFGIYFICYLLTESIEPDTVFLIDVAADHAIPFSKYASLLYCTWHLEIAVILLSYLYCRNLGGYWRLTIKLLLGLFAILFICLVFPNQVDLRPEVIEGNDIFAELTRMIYHIDNNHNVFPSGHALGAVLMAIGWGRISNRPWQKMAAWILNLGIIASTFLLKQHSMIDAAGGIALALFVDYTVEWILSTLSHRKYPWTKSYVRRI